MPVIVQAEPFDPYQALSHYQQTLQPGSYGAVVSFVGVMRDFNQDEQVTAMTLEHYPGMTERELTRVCQQAADRYGVDHTLVQHRIGDITPDEPIVLVAVWSSHRAAAFDACRFIINELKSKAPFWKREQSRQGARWVEGNSLDPAID